MGRRLMLASLTLAVLLTQPAGVAAVGQGQTAPAAQEPPIALLSDRGPVERVIAGGERHRYAVTLVAGEFLFVIVDQRGADIAARLIDADGTVRAEGDGPNGASGPDRIAVVAPHSGGYSVEIVNGAPASAGSGRYEIRVAAHRPATPDDVAHAEAEQLFNEGQVLLARNTAENRAAAAPRFARARATFTAQGYRYEAGLCFFNEGLLQLRAGTPRDAAGPLLAARDSFARGDAMYASVVNALGGMYDLLGDWDGAMTSYRQALDTSVTLRDEAREGVMRNNVGKLYADVGDWSHALEEYRQALAIARKRGDRRREALALHNIGVTYLSTRELARSGEFLEQALPIWRALRDVAGEAGTLTQIGVNASVGGDPDAAISRYEAALVLQAQSGNKGSEADTRARLGYAHLLAGRPAAAVEPLRAAAALAHDAGARRAEALALTWASQARLGLGDAATARALADEARSIVEPLRDGTGLGLSLIARARAERSLGNLAAALRSVTTAVEAFEAVRGTVSSPELRASFASRYHDAYLLAIDVLMQLHDRQPTSGFAAEALQVNERARARSLLELLGENGAGLRRGVPADLAARERDLVRALDARADRLITLRSGAASPEIAAIERDVRLLEAEYEEVRATIRRVSPAYASLTQPQPLGADAIRRTVLAPGTVLVEYALGNDGCYAWVVTPDRLTSVRLATRVEIEQAARDAYALVTARGALVAGETNAARARRIAIADAELPAALRRVSDLVLAPLGDLAGASRLAIVADGALQYLPFEMLPVPSARRVERALIVDVEIVMLPSASALALQRQQSAGRSRPPRGVAVFADPVFDSLDPRLNPRLAARSGAAPAAAPDPAADAPRLLVHAEGAAGSPTLRVPRLPATREEATAILAAAAGGQNLSAMGFDADKSAVTSGSLSQYRYVHFATHGLLDAERPSLSAVVLSLVGPNGQPRDGFLRTHEFYDLDLPADLVVLSACETGLGRDISGEGLVGLTRGLMYAGASRVIVSLWSVSDRATASLMGSLYRAMLKQGQAPAAALRAAQLTLMRDPRWRQPYYWAAFTLQGEWN